MFSAGNTTVSCLGRIYSRLASTGDKTGGKPTSFQPIEFSDTDEMDLSEGFRYEILRSSGDPLTANQVNTATTKST
jgi:secreted PhoX family phosphatase